MKVAVANLSLSGGIDTPQVDPLEAAIDRLTASSGTLFVLAAGNAGRFGAQTVTTPASADAALAVGGVSRSDELAVFSSQTQPGARRV